MGYNTEFRGRFIITPRLDDKLLDDLNKFCTERHENGFSFWCDWFFGQDEDGSSFMEWNGSEKSYSMDDWAIELQRKFFPGRKITGFVRARGEDFDDVWEMYVDNHGKICRRSVWYQDKE